MDFLNMLTIPGLKQECRERKIKFLSRWRKADYITAIRNSDSYKAQRYSRKYHAQKEYSGHSPTCTECLARQAFARDYDGALKCFDCASINGRYEKFPDNENAAIENYNALFWGYNDDISFINSRGCVVEIKPSNWFSVEAKLDDVLSVHFKDICYSYKYEFDERFSFDYTDYRLLDSREPLDFDMTLGELLEQEFGERAHPTVPSLFSLAQNVVGMNYKKLELYNVLPHSIVSEM